MISLTNGVTSFIGEFKSSLLRYSNYGEVGETKKNKEPEKYFIECHKRRCGDEEGKK